MNIGISAYFFRFPASGSGQYLQHLLNALAQADQRNQYVLLGPQPLALDRGNVRERNISYVTRSVPYLARRNENVEKLAWEQFTGPAVARKAGVDVLHVPYFAPPLVPRTPTVVTIHDAIPLRLPLYRAGARVAAYMRLVAFAARFATVVITVSQHAKQDIISALHLPAERIRVIYLAAGDEYAPVTDPQTLAAARTRYGLGADTRYILYLGGLDQRKNVPQLVRAFAHLYRLLAAPTGLQLLIAGDPDKQRGPLFPDPRPLADELGISEHIRYAFIAEEDKPTLYSGASLFVFPSLYEGFGLPPLEAMSCGAPVVCSNRTSLLEVVGDAAISVDPQDTQALVHAMRRVLDDGELAARLRGLSLERARHFSWRATALATLAVYEEACVRSRK